MFKLIHPITKAVKFISAKDDHLLIAAFLAGFKPVPGYISGKAA